ncbi:class I SAM-dependent methyltransferase [Methyloraptor flagellatus]|uniref:Methyltransferase domain-containing protein n=1 Tax=Methyloraptor flagellatus TaxID=3162530 RepID=A0AAU7X7U7_9HYPH
MGHPRLKETTAVLKHKVLDEFRFFRTWLDKPLTTGAVAPSSPALAKLMASYIDPSLPGSVVELGPGTGVVTTAIIERVAPSRVVSIEYNPEFCTLLRRRFPAVTFVQGDAYGLSRTLGDAAETPLAAVVSSLPLFTRPLPERVRLLEEAFDLLAPGAPFIQFSYALVPPVPPEAGRFELERSGWIVMNLPPARVWVYRRP